MKKALTLSLVLIMAKSAFALSIMSQAESDALAAKFVARTITLRDTLSIPANSWDAKIETSGLGVGCDATLQAVKRNPDHAQTVRAGRQFKIDKATLKEGVLQFSVHEVDSSGDPS